MPFIVQPWVIFILKISPYIRRESIFATIRDHVIYHQHSPQQGFFIYEPEAPPILDGVESLSCLKTLAFFGVMSELFSVPHTKAAASSEQKEQSLDVIVPQLSYPPNISQYPKKREEINRKRR